MEAQEDFANSGYLYFGVMDKQPASRMKNEQPTNAKTLQVVEGVLS